MSTYTVVKEDYDFLNRIKKYGFAVFNGIMLAWLAIAYMVGVAEETDAQVLVEEPAYGAGVGLFYIGIIWLVGNIILALLAWYLDSETPDSMHTTRL